MKTIDVCPLASSKRQLIGALLSTRDKTDLLQTALADEYLATLQYHTGATMAKNAKVKKELRQHAKEELEHADLLARRIIVLDGSPAPKSMWKALAFCSYTPPGKGDKKILQQNILGEMCAIDYYQDILNKNKVDLRTRDVIAHILEEEYEHLYDLTDLLKD